MTKIIHNLEITPLWERQRINGKLEPKKAYDYFNRYLNLPRPRRLRDVQEQLEKAKIVGTMSTLQTYSSKYDWIRRAEAYDNYMDEKRLEATVETNKKLGELRNEWIVKELESLKQRQAVCKANIGIVGKKIKKLLDNDTDDFNKIEQLNNILTVNNKSYNELSNQIMKLLGEDKVENKGVTINNINQQGNSLKDFTNALKEWYGEEEDEIYR